MFLDCPYCRSRLEYSKDPPRFCGYCGKPLGSTVDLQSSSSMEVAEAPTILPAPMQVTHGNVDDGDATLVKPPNLTKEFHFRADPDLVGGYRLLRKLGGGGMGTVYEAQEPGTKRRVAIKLISPEFLSHAESLARFRQEGRLASRLAHPRCVFVYKVDEDAGRPYIVMELMPGKTLLELVRERGTLPPEEAVLKILDVIDGLREAHKLGLIHRDVKPSNCFLQRDGRVKIGDFGLSKTIHMASSHSTRTPLEDPSLTKTGAFVGTPLYAAPEQVKGERVDQQADVYAVAATLYFLLTGKAPFEGASDAMATMARIVSDDPSSIRDVRPDVSATLDQVILRGLARDRKKRWKDLDAFRNALLPFLPKATPIVGLSLRVGAVLTDFFLTYSIVWTIEWLWEWVHVYFLKASATASVDWKLLGNPIYEAIIGPWVLILYFSLCETKWGCTPGKWLTRLRVHKAISGENPDFLQSFGRAAIFIYILLLLELILLGFMYLQPSGQFAMNAEQRKQMNVVMIWFIQWPSLLVGVLLLSMTMRKRNGYRGLHEVLTGTRVVGLPWQWQPEKLRMSREFQPSVGVTSGMPVRIGPFAIKGVLSMHGKNQIYVGQDESLARPVWIWQRPRSDASSSTHSAVDRAGRWRWLGSGVEGDQEWDAWLATKGTFLRDIIAQDGTLSWQEARHLMQSLAEELLAACKDHSLPAQLTPAQVWVQSDGGVQILDIPMESAGGDSGATPGLDDNARAMSFLRQILLLSLEGQVRSVESAHHLRVALPVHADRIVNRFLGYRKPPLDLEGLLKVLQETASMPTEVTRLRRLAHFFLHGFILLFMMSVTFAVMLPLIMFTGISKWMQNDAISIQIGFTVLFGLLIVLAAVSGGGVSFNVMGMALWNRAGGPATARQAALRTFVVGLPLYLLILIDQYLTYYWYTPAVYPIKVINSSLMGLYVLVHLGLFLWKPSESWHDRLVRTVVVPK